MFKIYTMVPYNHHHHPFELQSHTHTHSHLHSNLNKQQKHTAAYDHKFVQIIDKICNSFFFL